MGLSLRGRVHLYSRCCLEQARIPKGTGAGQGAGWEGDLRERAGSGLWMDDFMPHGTLGTGLGSP